MIQNLEQSTFEIVEGDAHTARQTHILQLSKIRCRSLVWRCDRVATC